MKVDGQDGTPVNGSSDGPSAPPSSTPEDGKTGYRTMIIIGLTFDGEARGTIKGDQPQVHEAEWLAKLEAPRMIDKIIRELEAENRKNKPPQSMIVTPKGGRFHGGK